MRPGVFSAPTRGFTLLEVLLAMFLLGMLVAMAYAGLSAGIRATDSGYKAIDRTNKVRLTQEFLRRQVSRSLPVIYESDPIEGTAFLFEGGPDVMRFVSTMPGYLSHGGGYVQTVRVQNERDGLALVFEHELLNGYGEEGVNRAEPADPVRLLDGIASARFEFARVDLELNEVQWVETWDEPHIPPLLVRIAIEMKPDSGVTWPEMVIPMMIDGPSNRRPEINPAGRSNRRPELMPGGLRGN